MSYESSKKAINTYTILCTIKPKSREFKYPYNPWSPEKVELTMNELELYSSGKGVFTTAPRYVKGGNDSANNSDNQQIMVFVSREVE